MSEHKEIIAALKKIPSLIKEFHKLDKSIAGTDEKRKALSKEDYQLVLLNFDAKDARGTGLKAKILRTGHELSSAKPDFNLSCQNINALHNYVKVIGKDAMSERVSKQLELSELLEVQKEFQSINDFLDDAKIKALNTYLKGKKQNDL
ncbi:hypothetical protein [Sulfurimonas sp. NWX367]|uniref:hypothetical protein n=1 Tax=Sulfurimonas sp. NWX367 TaxID=2925413 RepID=UPI003204CE07